MLNDNIEKVKKGVYVFLQNSKNEIDDTKEAFEIVKRHLAKDETLTNKDYQILKLQIYDLLKILGIGIPYILIPGSVILMPIILKISEKYNIELLPTNFKNKNINENNSSNTLSE